MLQALHEAGFDPQRADLIVGTSAGAVIGAEIRAGKSVAEIRAHVVAPAQADSDYRSPTDVFSRSWGSPVALARRLVGSAYVVGRSLVRVPGPRMPQLLRQVFPAGLFAPSVDPAVLEELVAPEWPDEPLWLVAVDIASGRRVVLGRDGGPDANLHQAVLASCAIPAFYQPVRVSGVTLVDGGVHSTTNLDLAAEADCDLIIVVAPLGYDRQEPPGLATRVSRRPTAAAIARELVYSRAQGSVVLILRPTAAEMGFHGINPMRIDGNAEVADAAYEAATRRLQSPRFQRVLKRFDVAG